MNFDDGADNTIPAVVPDRGGVTWISPTSGAVLHLAHVSFKPVVRQALPQGCSLARGC